MLHERDAEIAFKQIAGKTETPTSKVYVHPESSETYNRKLRCDSTKNSEGRIEGFTLTKRKSQKNADTIGFLKNSCSRP